MKPKSARSTQHCVTLFVLVYVHTQVSPQSQPWNFFIILFRKGAQTHPFVLYWKICSSELPDFTAAFKTLRFNCSLLQALSPWQPWAAPESPLRLSTPLLPKLQVNIHNFVPPSGSAAQPPTVRPTALLDIEASTSPFLLDYISVPVRLRSLNQDTVSKRTLCLSVATSALKT